MRKPLTNNGGLYDWSTTPADVRALPFEPPPVTARVRLVIAGEPITLTREIVYRYRDQAIGEIRRPLFVTRDADIAIAPDEILWPIDGAGRSPRRFTLTVTNRARGDASPLVVRAALTPPPGWPPVSPESLTFTREDETKSVTLSLAPPATDSLKPGAYEARASVVGSDGRRRDGGLEIIDYPHIRPRAVARSLAV